MLICAKSGHYTVVTGKWPDHLKDLVKSSAVAEPLALLGLIRQLFPRGVRGVHIEHFTDNQGLKGTVNKGYSTKSGQYIMYALSRGWPNMTFKSYYCPGAIIPVDDTSRGASSLDDDKLLAFLERHVLQTPNGLRAQQELGDSAKASPSTVHPPARGLSPAGDCPN